MASQERGAVDTYGICDKCDGAASRYVAPLGSLTLRAICLNLRLPALDRYTDFFLASYTQVGAQ